MKITVSTDNFSKTNNGIFEGWGTSLCWWAHRVGYSEQLCNKSAELFFSEKGLGLNIMRYNIGGGDNPLHNHIERTDSAVPGWIDFDEKSGKKIWNYDADKNQLSVLKSAYKAAGNDAYVEVFSNSPPYFMTVSGCSSGSENGIDTNLKPECIDEFAEYLAAVSEYIENKLGIMIKSVSPMNEPDTDYWKMLSPKQEGCHISPGKIQSEIICSVRKAFDDKGLNHIIVAASDETSTERQINSYNLYSESARRSIGRISTHTYITEKIHELGKLREKEGFNLWMSEVDGSGVAGDDAGEMSSGIWLSKKIISDINALSPSAWVLWLVIDYHKSTNGFGGNTDNYSYDKNSGFWGLGHCDHDIKEFVLTQKYYSFGQFTRYIRKGMSLIHINDCCLGAYDYENKQCIIVAVNDKKESEGLTVNLEGFKIFDGSTDVITTYNSGKTAKKWYKDKSLKCIDNVLTVTLNPNSVTTFIINGINIEY